MTGGSLNRPLPVVHVITDDRRLRRSDFVTLASGLLRSGGHRVAIHLRGPRTGGALLERLAQALRPDREGGGWLVINDRIDVAGVVTAEGVQLGRRSLPLDVARRLLPDALVGASVHGLEEARQADAADWLVLGTIYETPSHPGRRAAGLAHVGRVARGVSRPIIAIGGITPERARLVRSEGAAGVAVSGGIWGAPDPIAALDNYLAAWGCAA
jgi:thiamine-phosphate diphosphorylase